MTQEKAYSFKSLRRDKAIKSRDLYRVRYSDLVVVPGNNERDKDERYWHSINALEKFLLGGGQVAPLEVEVNPKTGAIEIVQGHRRHEAFGRVIPAKQEQLRSLIREDMTAADKAKLLEKVDDLEFIECIPFQGNDLQKLVRIGTGNEHLALTEVETARLYKRAQVEFGLNATEISKAFNKPRDHVDRHLALANADHGVQEAVKTGKIAVTEAVKIAKEHGSDAVEVIEKEYAKAVKQGSKKVTAGTMKGSPLPRPVVNDLVGNVAKFRRSLSPEAETVVNDFREGRIDGGQVTIDVVPLMALLAAHGNVEAVQEEQRKRAEAKAAKAAEKAEAAKTDDDDL
ncbi:TPA: hypothetical protein L4W87_001356 [Pseudomonas aeruginosa]|nr:hypothetical protein [Pseudomonas aeruginosa]